MITRTSKILVLVGALVASSATLSDTIIDDNGFYYEAPEGYKAVFVPEDTPEVLLAVEVVKLVEPDNKQCRQRDVLVLGPGEVPTCPVAP